MDLLTLILDISFEGSLAAAGVLLLLAYVAFARMNKDVRRARMFIMADRVNRFLGAFTFAVLLLAAVLILGSLGVGSTVIVSGITIFLFLGAIVYGSLEMFLIIRPPRSKFGVRRRRQARTAPAVSTNEAASEDSAEGDVHAAR